MLLLSVIQTLQSLRKPSPEAVFNRPIQQMLKTDVYQVYEAVRIIHNGGLIKTLAIKNQKTTFGIPNEAVKTAPVKAFKHILKNRFNLFPSRFIYIFDDPIWLYPFPP
ncbi:MAG: hypothetical protein ACKOA1_08950 [Bacteroidota bacterium]